MARTLLLVFLLLGSLSLAASCGGGGEKSNEGARTELMVTSTTAEGDKVTVVGTTNLPDHSSLVVGLDLWGRSDAEPDIGVDTVTFVSEGTFLTTINAPQRDEFEEGPYEISISFDPRQQVEEILFVVGIKGQKMLGDFVVVEDGYNLIRMAERREFDLSFTPPSYTFQTPSDFQEGTAERAMAEYILAWRDKDWLRMANYADPVWMSRQADPETMLAGWHETKSIKGFEIVGAQKISDRVMDITFLVQYELLTKQVFEKEITARVINTPDSSSSGSPDRWGVEATTVVREKEVG
ncbi:MAG: hypothetical protein V3U79_12085 [Dehalococcoidia bacterium]